MEKINFGKSDAKRKIKYLTNYQILEKNICLLVMQIIFLLTLIILQRYLKYFFKN